MSCLHAHASQPVPPAASSGSPYAPQAPDFLCPAEAAHPGVSAESAPARGRNVHSVYEQGSGRCNEDALLCAPPLYAVFDGASCLCGNMYKGASGAWWAANTARSVFADTRYADMPLNQLAMRANRAVGAAMEQHGVDTGDSLRVWSASMAAFRVREDVLEYVQIGDSLILCITDKGCFLPAPYHNHDRETLCRWRTLAEQGVRNLRIALHDHICAVRQGMNRTYGVLNGDDRAQDFLHWGTVPLHGVRHVLAFTDGLHLPSESPQDTTDFSALAALVSRQGLHGLHAAVRHAECGDPQCLRYPRFKTHDDIAAVAVTL